MTSIPLHSPVALHPSDAVRPLVRGARLLSGRLNATDVAFWCLVAALIIGGRAYIAGGPTLSNDGYQYLSIADSFARGHFARTSIIHFDTERSHGQAPAPITTFPPGYPFAISLLASVGLPAEHAALAISLASTWLLVPLLLWAAHWLRWPRIVAYTALAWLVTNSWFSAMAEAVATEPLFALITFMAVLAFVRAEGYARSHRQYSLLLVLAGTALGLSYWIRYAGLFLFASAALYYAFRLPGLRDRRAWAAACGLALALAMISIGLVRNQVLVGSWMGGNTKPVEHAVAGVARRFVGVVYHLLLGDARAGLGAAELVWLMTSLIVVGALTVGWWGTAWAAPDRAASRFIVLFILVYSSALFYLGLTSVISMVPRMLYPLVPAAVLLAGLLASRVEAHRTYATRRPALTALLLLGCVISYGAINFRGFATPPAPAPHQLVGAHLASTMDSGTPLREWIEATIPKHALVVANEGQATGYVLQRPTVSLVSRHFSAQRWTADAVEAVMTRFGARYLIIYPSGETVNDSSFLTALANRQWPAWLTPVASNEGAIVFQRTSAP